MDNLQATYMNKNPFVRYFSRIKDGIAIKIADIKKNDKILDFGCGAGWLKNNLRKRGFNIIGYDKTPSQTEIEDYRKIKANKIFALDVFEHIEEKEILEIIRNFKIANNNFKLIVAIPTENFISRKIRKLLGKKERVEGHITPMKKILKILNSELILEKKFNFLFISYIARFRN